MEQNSFDWLLWRRQGIGSSDSPIVMGVSPHSTRLMLYEDKVSVDPPDEKNEYILEVGKRMEPKMRAIFEFQMETPFAPKLVQMEQYPFLRASLDGCSPGGQEIAEFKFVGKEVFEDAKNRVVPKHYFIQIQKQLLVSQANRAWYVCSADGKSIAKVPVAPDLKLQKEILEADIAFWTQHVLKRKPPEPCERDFKKLRASGLSRKLEKWKKLRIQIEELETQKEEIEEWCKSLIQDETHPRWIASNIAFNKIVRKGSVDYSKVPELKNVDLEQYRKANTSYIEMRILKS